MSEVSVKALAPEDHADWRQLWTGYLTFYGSSVSEEVYTTSWERLLSGRAGEFSGLIARSADGAALGLTHYLFHRHGWRIENVCYLQDLFVAEAARGAGVGRALIEAVYRAADDAGCGNVYWLTQTGNSRARAVYDQVAFATDFIKYQRQPR